MQIIVDYVVFSDYFDSIAFVISSNAGHTIESLQSGFHALFAAGTRQSAYRDCLSVHVNNLGSKAQIHYYGCRSDIISIILV